MNASADAPRQRYHHGNLPTALVQAALELVTERGAEALTLRAVAQRVGVSHAAPYRHFKDKRALVSTIAAQGFRLLAEELDKARQQHDGQPTLVGGMTRAYLTFAQERPAHYRVMYGVLAQPDIHAELRREMDNVVHILREAMAKASGSGDSSGARSRHAGTLYWAQLHGLAALQVAGKLPPNDAASIDALAAALIEDQPPAMAAVPR